MACPTTLASGAVITSANFNNLVNAVNLWCDNVNAASFALANLRNLVFRQNTAPAAPASGDITVYMDSADSKWKWKDSAGNIHFVTGQAAAFTAGSIVFGDSVGRLGQDNANLFWDNTGKRLGIGTTGPQSFLHVKSTAGSTFLTVENANDAGDPWLQILRQSASVGKGWAIHNTGNNLYFASGVNTAGSTTGFADKVTFVEAGNVGIGTTGPTISGTGKLHVAGDTARPFDAANTPTGASAGNIGEIRFDASFVYVCTAANVWKRATLATF